MRLPKEMPTCVDCGAQHWHFQVCEQKAERLENEKPPLNPPRFNPPGVDYGHRLETVQVLGGSTIVQRRRVAAPTGKVTPSPNWEER